MGASSSTEQKVSSEQREAESLAASTGALPTLQNAFSKLADPHSNAIPLQSLLQCFCLSYKNHPVCESAGLPDYFTTLLSHLGQSLVDQFFVLDKGGVSWVEFVRGYLKCCGRMPALLSLNAHLRVFAAAAARAGAPFGLEFESDDNDCKISGSFLPRDVLVLFWICWTLLWDSKTSTLSKGNENLYLPNVSHLVLSAVVSCAEESSSLNIWDCGDFLGFDVQLPAGKFLTWVLATVPGLSDCLILFVNARLEKLITLEDVSETSRSTWEEMPPTNARSSYLLTCGKAWAISLTIRGTISAEILKPFLSSDSQGTDESLLYRSSVHGKGLNRFWSNIEGYYGPLLILIAATSGDTHENSTNGRKWIIGALTHQGFENRDLFYGSSGSLYAISPVFHVFSPSGKEKNFIYSHLHPTGKVYEPHPKPVGIAFGGHMGNERIFIDEDFARVTVRHHAVDKTYQPGPLFPCQGFVPVEALISEVEVWGFGGKKAKEVQTSYKKREQLFTDQRRKVDLKSFANWEDSPEKMMMEMMSDPNRVQREDR